MQLSCFAVLVWQYKGVAIFGRRKRDLTDLGVITGTARVDQNTQRLVRRLGAGDVAVIDHPDLDSASAQALAESGVVAVLNAAASTSGRYPNLGPSVLLEAGVLLIDDLGSSVMDIAEGASVVISPAGEVRVGEQLIAQGTVLSSETNTENLARARSGLPLQLKAFASNTMAYVEAQQALILDGVGIPEVRTQIAGKHVMVVARGHRYREELKELRHYIREYQPVIIGVDAGADAVLEAGYHLSMIVGDMDSVSEKALRSGAEIVVHGSPEGHNPGERRVQDLGLPHIVFAAAGMSDDVAILLAAAHDADLIVAVGSYSTLAEAFDRGRRGMASALITRLQVGAKLVDANAVLHLYRSRISNWQLALFIVAGAAAIGTAMIATAAGQVSVGIAGSWFAAVGAWLGGIF